jgi:hypothetical protein
MHQHLRRKKELEPANVVEIVRRQDKEQFISHALHDRMKKFAI